MPSKPRLKSCQHCAEASAIRYRIQFDWRGQWQLVCPSCWQQLSQNNPDYRYGGTWKAK